MKEPEGEEEGEFVPSVVPFPLLIPRIELLVAIISWAFDAEIVLLLLLFIYWLLLL